MKTVLHAMIRDPADKWTQVDYLRPCPRMTVGERVRVIAGRLHEVRFVTHDFAANETRHGIGTIDATHDEMIAAGFRLEKKDG